MSIVELGKRGLFLPQKQFMMGIWYCGGKLVILRCDQYKAFELWQREK